MQSLQVFFEWLNGIVWGVPMIVLILGTGFYLQLRLGFMPLRKIVYGFQMIGKSRTPGNAADGEISPFAALMTALSATVGTGNIAGVAAAISVGGPGALFWMWMTAMVGMATKYAEVVLAVKYREVDDHGEHVGGHRRYDRRRRRAGLRPADPGRRRFRQAAVPAARLTIFSLAAAHEAAAFSPP